MQLCCWPNFDTFLALFKFLRVTSPIGCQILVPYVKMEILRYDKVSYLAKFSTSSFLNFNHKNRWPCKDFEARDLKFCMQPSFTKTHPGKKVENDPREKLQFRTLYCGSIHVSSMCPCQHVSIILFNGDFILFRF